MKKLQAGFTLIELVMVIVILGILAAFALPKFADLSGDAELAAARAGLGAVKSAAGIAHAADLAGGSTGVVRLEGTDYTLVNSYPSSENIDVLASLDGYTVVDTSSSLATITLTGSTCVFTYSEAGGGGGAPTYSPVTCP